MNNRIWNCKNPYQGNAKKVLCVCSASLLRSPSAAIVLQREFGYNTRSCGVDKDHALIPLDEVLLHWADEIVCMDYYQGTKVSEMLEKEKLRRDVKVLEIPDRFEYMNQELQDLILEKYNENGRD